VFTESRLYSFLYFDPRKMAAYQQYESILTLATENM
jgi:hypothetical protein